jgi:4-hydroxybenzoate polyprenyltransferase
VGISLYITDKWVIALLWLSIFFGYFYSAPPIRFKELPILDSLSNISYTLPGVAVYVYYAQAFPSLALWLVVLLWPAAMHLFSAVVDYESDLEDNVMTTAVWLGKWKAVWLCAAYWGLVSVLLFMSNLILFGLISLIYPLIMVYILYRREIHLFKLYTYFPWINMGVGMLVTIFLLVSLL